MGSLCIWVRLLNKCEISNSYCLAMTCFGIKPCVQIIFNSDLNCLSVLSNVDRKYYQCIPKKRQPLRFQSRDVLLVHTKERWHNRMPFFCQKTIFLYFENIISSSQRTSRCRNWVTSPLAAKISCCLTRCTFVFYANQTTKFIGIFV